MATQQPKANNTHKVNVTETLDTKTSNREQQKNYRIETVSITGKTLYLINETDKTCHEKICLYIWENKGADLLRGNRAFVFTT